MARIMNEQQRAAGLKLREALAEATAAEYFDSDEAQDSITPTVINAFCDGVDESLNRIE